MNIITKPAFSLLSILIACGVTAHDGQFEHAVAAAAHNGDAHVASIDLANIEMRGRHTHSESDPTQSLINSFRYTSPSIGPNRRTHHKRILAELETAGRHAFDNVTLPVLYD